MARDKDKEVHLLWVAQNDQSEYCIGGLYHTEEQLVWAKTRYTELFGKDVMFIKDKVWIGRDILAKLN